MAPKAILLDIEGTVCPISFVHTTLFPYAKKQAHELIGSLDNSVFPVTKSSGNDHLINHLLEFPPEVLSSKQSLLDHIDDLINRDVKDPALKSLQGFLWRSGYESGQIKAPLYADAIETVRSFASENLDNPPNGVYIYSSGSIAAQLLLFKHAETLQEIADSSPQDSIDLTTVIRDYFDTTNAGPKTAPESYTRISKQISISPEDILFFSDNVAEVAAALEAGLQARVVVRPGNNPLPEGTNQLYTVVTDIRI